MSDLEIPVMYKGEERIIPATVHRYGYVYKLEVEINGVKVFFERDDEGNWRALLPYEDVATNKGVDKDLLAAVAESLDEVTK